MSYLSLTVLIVGSSLILNSHHPGEVTARSPYVDLCPVGAPTVADIYRAYLGVR